MRALADRDLARMYLARPLPRRWRHVQGVAHRADTIAGHLNPVDAELLVSAAWLHDIGYAPPLATTGFHPLDGAVAIRELGVGERLWGLVAHHSAAIHEAREFGVTTPLAEFRDEQGLVRDLLWYLDMTTDPDGRPVSFAARMADVRARYGSEHFVGRALGPSMGDRQAAVDRAIRWLTTTGYRLDHR
ncbi:HD domain-containing protein [Pseudonocardia sp. DR1-2]|uniref:HD domain-containing protein n=1 Tax=Pseudonocardia sp. DR1-2 TaxID=2951168 RepID=UPI0020444AF4|nr:HD domain-containing protein [Pseudonocardia sp. DR1-2]MCM3850102.1 HD domain-containing protein [Pseudonocardia sp. DR1-2]